MSQRKQSKAFLYDVFLCHNTHDKPEVEKIAGELRGQGLRCWLDKRELRPGADWQEFITSQWPRISAIVVFFGPHGVSEGQRFEIDNLVRKNSEGHESVISLLPTIPKDMGWKDIIPADLQNRIGVDFRNSKADPATLLRWGILGENPYVRQTIGTYYRDADGLEDNQLMKALGKITASTQLRSFPFPQGVRKHIERLFEDPDNPDNLILFHDDASVPKASHYGRDRGNPRAWSLDQIWPKAFGFLQHRRVSGDLHNVAPAAIGYNAGRGAGFFYDRRLDFSAKEVEVSPTRYFDPRGVIARACLYMAVRYQGDNGEPDLVLDEQHHVRGEPHLGSLETLLYWNKLVKVSRAERNRNDMIASENRQGNRNPFVDRPEFADLIWYPV